jgi:hypothetical protein
MATASSVAEPRSRSRFDRCDGFSRDGDSRQQRRFRSHPGDDAAVASTYVEAGSGRADGARRLRRGAVVSPRREPRGLTRRVDAPHLHGHRGEPGKTQHQHHDQRRHRERGLDGDTARLIVERCTPGRYQTLVFSARVMMLVSALTIESPVTTV